MYLYWLMFYGTAVQAISFIADPDGLEAINFAKPFPGKKLSGSVFQELSVDSEVSCQIACVKEIRRCFSYNFGSMNKDENFTCQLSDSDRFTSHEKFTEDDKMLYRGIQVKLC